MLFLVLLYHIYMFLFPFSWWLKLRKWNTLILLLLSCSLIILPRSNETECSTKLTIHYGLPTGIEHFFALFCFCRRYISLIMALQKSIEIFKRTSTYHTGIKYNELFCSILVSRGFPCFYCILPPWCATPCCSFGGWGIAQLVATHLI